MGFSKNKGFGVVGGGAQPGQVILKGAINVAADFPTSAEVQIGWYYIVVTAVTDNDPTKTNTGQSFSPNDDPVWTGSSWSLLGSDAVMSDDGIDVKTINDPRNIDLQSAGLKDVNVTTPVKLGDAINTSFVTTNQTIIGSLNELSSSFPTAVSKSFIATAGQTAFVLDSAPTDATSFKLFRNGQLAQESIDYTRATTTITWLDATGPLSSGEWLFALYDDSTVSAAPISTVFGRTGAITAVLNDYDASEVNNDSSVGGATVAGALDSLLDVIPPDAPIDTVFGRVGTVIAATSDYDASQVDNDSSVTGATVKDALDTLDGSLGGTKSIFIPTDPNANYGLRRVRNIGATGGANINFFIPKDFNALVKAVVIGYPVSGAGGTGRDIDILGEYTLSSGQNYQQYTFSDTTTTYDTGTDDTRFELDITSLLTNLAAGADGGFNIDHNGIGGGINYIGTEIQYT